MELVMTKDKDCKHSVRYADGEGHNIYLKNAEVDELGNPKSIEVQIQAKKD